MLILKKTLKRYAGLNEAERLSMLSPHTIPSDKIFNTLSTIDGSLTLAMLMRSDVIEAMDRKHTVTNSASNNLPSSSPTQGTSTTNTTPVVTMMMMTSSKDNFIYLTELDLELKKWLQVALSPDLIELKRITYNQSNQVVKY